MSFLDENISTKEIERFPWMDEVRNSKTIQEVFSKEIGYVSSKLERDKKVYDQQMSSVWNRNNPLAHASEKVVDDLEQALLIMSNKNKSLLNLVDTLIYAMKEETNDFLLELDRQRHHLEKELENFAYSKGIHPGDVRIPTKSVYEIKRETGEDDFIDEMFREAADESELELDDEDVVLEDYDDDLDDDDEMVEEEKEKSKKTKKRGSKK